ncbi:hypothetical protein AC249_AIPGENE18810 [Exaiptasia diaphana]|nr:hypothetical protein AC249_AIPGENE18810 [Exaiptasia diaphana]
MTDIETSNGAWKKEKDQNYPIMPPYSMKSTVSHSLSPVSTNILLSTAANCTFNGHLCGWRILQNKMAGDGLLWTIGGKMVFNNFNNESKGYESSYVYTNMLSNPALADNRSLSSNCSLQNNGSLVGNGTLAKEGLVRNGSLTDNEIPACNESFAINENLTRNNERKKAYLISPQLKSPHCMNLTYQIYGNDSSLEAVMLRQGRSPVFYKAWKQIGRTNKISSIRINLYYGGPYQLN